MKSKNTLLAVLFCITTYAQQPLNPSFDSVYFGGIDRVFDWITSDGLMMNAGTFSDTVIPLQANTQYPPMGLQFHELLWMGQRVDTSPFSNVAIQLWSHPEKTKPTGANFESMIVNGNQFYTDSSGFIDLSKGGIPCTDRPEVLYGYYQFADSTLIGLNAGRCVLLLKKWNSSKGHSDTIAFVNSTTDLLPTSGWSPFQIPLNYLSNDSPDSLVLAFFANTKPDQKSVLWLDELYFGPAFTIPELSNKSVRIYPNPVHNRLFIEYAERFSVYNIYDIQGRILQKGKLEESINLINLSSQILLVELIGKEHQKLHIKVIKTD